METVQHLLAKPHSSSSLVIVVVILIPPFSSIIRYIGNTILFTGTSGSLNGMVSTQIPGDVDDDGYYCFLRFGPSVSLAVDGTISKVEQDFTNFQP